MIMLMLVNGKPQLHDIFVNYFHIFGIALPLVSRETAPKKNHTVWP